MNPSHMAISRHDQLTRARMIQHTLGVRAAAAYMRKHQWSLEAALQHLCGPAACERAKYGQISA